MNIARRQIPPQATLCPELVSEIEKKTGDSGEIKAVWVDKHGYGYALWVEFVVDSEIKREFVKL